MRALLDLASLILLLCLCVCALYARILCKARFISYENKNYEKAGIYYTEHNVYVPSCFDTAYYVAVSGA